MLRMATARLWLAAPGCAGLAAREPWVASLGADSRMRGKEAVRLAESAVVAELAVRHAVSEGTIRPQAHTAGALVERLPLMWEMFADGMVSEQNAAEAARLAMELPAESWTEFDLRLIEVAHLLTPAKFRLKARGIRERIHPKSAQTRHESAREDRRVWMEPDRDGMAWLGAYVPADVAYNAMARVDQTAFELAKLPDETRSMPQLRADVLGDVLLDGLTTQISRLP